jgi:hypothetical protein
VRVALQTQADKAGLHDFYRVCLRAVRDLDGLAGNAAARHLSAAGTHGGGMPCNWHLC